MRPKSDFGLLEIFKGEDEPCTPLTEQPYHFIDRGLPLPLSPLSLSISEVDGTTKRALPRSVPGIATRATGQG